MLPAITTTHAIPRHLPSSHFFARETSVSCCYCLAVLGRASDSEGREALQKAHHCKAKRLARKPSAAVPYN